VVVLSPAAELEVDPEDEVLVVPESLVSAQEARTAPRTDKITSERRTGKGSIQ
jgi:hypothetical protein